MPESYDLFFSYAHKDDLGNAGDDSNRIKAIKNAIEVQYREMTGRDVHIFLDTDDITTGDDWRHRLLRGLQSSRMLLAFVSENYFKSEYCRLEWEHYIQTELAHALPGQGIAPVYIIRCPEFDEKRLDERLRRWARDLERRQVDVDWLDWWPHGQSALERVDVKKRLTELVKNVHDRLARYGLREKSPTNQMPLLTEHFKGRQRELHELRSNLVKGNVGAITAVNGIPGIGKTELALAYAWGYGAEYPAGRFYLNLAGTYRDDQDAIERLKQQIADLAEWKGVPVSDVERQTPDAVFRKVMKSFTDQPKQAALFILDNIDDPRLLKPSLLAQCIPQGEDFDVIITTRLPRTEQSRLAWVPVDFLETEDGVALLDSIVPIPDSPQDAQWKAAYGVAQRLGGHAQALTVVGVFMRLKKDDSYIRVLENLEREGLSLVNRAGEELEQRDVGLDSAYTERVLERLLTPTLDHLQQHHPAAWRAFQLAAYCPPDQVPLPWLEAILALENPAWGADQIGGSMARQAINLLIDYRLLVPIRMQQAELVNNQNRDDSPLARMHRVYQDILRGSTSKFQSNIIQSWLTIIAGGRAEILCKYFGQPNDRWEINPIEYFADAIDLLADPHDLIEVRLLDNLSQLLQHSEDTRKPERYLKQACRVMESINAGAPKNVEYLASLIVTYLRLGDLFRSRKGDFENAEPYFVKAVEACNRLMELDTENLGFLRLVGIAYNKLGRLLFEIGQAENALPLINNVLTLREHLLREFSEDSYIIRDLSTSFFDMAQVYRALNEHSKAAQYQMQSLELSRRLWQSDSENPQFASDFAVSQSRMGDSLRYLGDDENAKDFYESALEINEFLAENFPDNVQFSHNLCASCMSLSEIAASNADSKAEQKWLERARSILVSMIKRGMFVSDDDMKTLDYIQSKLQ